MSEARKKADWPIVAAIFSALALVLVTVYVGGYFAMGRTSHPTFPNEGVFTRTYREHWAAMGFYPAGKIESWLTGRSVRIESEWSEVPGH